MGVPPGLIARGLDGDDGRPSPWLKNMWSGWDHKAAFRNYAQKLDVRYNTVSSECTRAPDLTTDKFMAGHLRRKALIQQLVKAGIWMGE